jgi:translation initiation factor 3 subunit M
MLTIGSCREAYNYLIRALRTLTTEEASSPTAQDLALRALRTALNYPSHFDFQDLISLDPIQALRKSHPIYFELLEIFNAENLDDYNDFNDEHDGWLESQLGLDQSRLYRKMRLLTLASLAASIPTRALPYSKIASALQIPEQDVEMWVIDVIRAGLVEGKLSQQKQLFLIHRSTYRVFGEKQWIEVATRLETWRESLKGVLEVVKREREMVIMQKEREMREMEGKATAASSSGRRGGGQQQRETVEVGGE